MKRSRLGFTLIELLVVVVIVGILAGLALPNFSRAAERAKVKDAQAVLSSIFSAERVYYLDENRFATDTSLYVNNHYVTNPNSGAGADWAYTVASPDPGSTFTATATRSGTGTFGGQTITVTQAFNGTQYGGNHPLRDQ